MSPPPDPGTGWDAASEADLAVVGEQLGRPARAVAGVAWRCPCGRPGVVATEPRLPRGTPFPTTYYLTCPRAVAACSRLEAAGVMAEMGGRLARDPELAEAYARAHRSYLADRSRLGEVAEIAGVSAGGMPDRVKCLHVLLGHALAAGAGVNPLGDEVAETVGEFWRRPCGAEGSTADGDDGGHGHDGDVVGEGGAP